VNVVKLNDGSSLYHDARGIMQVYDCGAGVSLHVRRGVMGDEFAKYVIEDGERQLREWKRYVLMVDGLETKMHTTEFRELMTAWFQEHETAVVHMLIRSRMLEMAINVANLVMGVTRARAYFNADNWLAAGRQAVASFAPRPLVIPDGLEITRALTQQP
jgi:hypothetical protein